MKDTATWSPSATWVTLVPTSVTMPEPSCPPTTGNMDFTPISSSTSGVWLMSPVRRCSSEWHMPDQTIFTRTSRLPGGSISISSVFQGSFSPVHTAARVVVIVNPSLRFAVEFVAPSVSSPVRPRDNRACGAAAVVCPRGRPRRRSPRWPPGCATGGGGGPTTRSAPSTSSTTRPGARGAASVQSGRAFALGLPALGGGGDPGRVHRGPGQPDPDHGPGQPPGQRRPARLGLLQRGRPHPGHPVRHPLGRAGPQQLRRRHLQRLPGVDRARPTAPPAVASTGSATVVSRGVLLDVARALGRDVLEPGHPIMPGDLDAACELAGVALEPGDIVLVRTGQMVHLAAGAARPGRLHLPVARPHHRDGRVVPRPRRRRRGHRHAALRGLPVPVRGRLPAGAPPAPGRDGA